MSRIYKSHSVTTSTLTTLAPIQAPALQWRTETVSSGRKSVSVIATRLKRMTTPQVSQLELQNCIDTDETGSYASANATAATRTKLALVTKASVYWLQN